jgi:hypothetical protein
VDFLRTGLGIVAILAGTWSWAEGAPGGTSALAVGFVVVGWLLVAAAALAVLRLLGSNAALITAAVVALSGVTFLVLPDRWPIQFDSAGNVKYVLLTIGFATLLWPRTRVVGPECRKAWAVLWPMRYVVHRPGPVTTVVAVALGVATLDLSHAERPDQPRIDLFIRVLGGSVTVVFPPDWTVVPWHVESAHAVALKGQFSHPRLDEDPGNENESDADGDAVGLSRVWTLVTSFFVRPQTVEEAPPTVRASISGVGGSVTFVRA